MWQNCCRYCAVTLKRPEIRAIIVRPTLERQHTLTCGLAKGVMILSDLNLNFEVTTFFEIGYIGPDWFCVK